MKLGALILMKLGAFLVLIGLRFGFSPLVEFQLMARNSTNDDGAVRPRGKLASESRSLSTVFCSVVGFGIYFPEPERESQPLQWPTLPRTIILLRKIHGARSVRKGARVLK
jgi:hypothetical protein